MLSAGRLDANMKPRPAEKQRKQLAIMTGYRILVASYTDRITTLLFDPIGPILIVTSEVKVGTRPSWLTAHPTDPSLIFTGLEQREGVVVALRYDEDGNGTIVSQIPSGGADPASLLATADTLLVGNVRVIRRHLHWWCLPPPSTSSICALSLIGKI
jgi:Lactonase, 7-bladed beta-propeller